MPDTELPAAWQRAADNVVGFVLADRFKMLAKGHHPADLIGEDFVRQLVARVAQDMSAFAEKNPLPECECGRCFEKVLASGAAIELAVGTGRMFDWEVLIRELNKYLDSRS